MGGCHGLPSCSQTAHFGKCSVHARSNGVDYGAPSIFEIEERRRIKAWYSFVFSPQLGCSRMVDSENDGTLR